MSEISDARLALHAQLVTYLAGALSADRVHLYTPPQIASPCVWIAQPGVEIVAAGGNGSRVRVVTFGVYTVVDGYEPAQCELLDELVARVADAIYDLKRAEDAGARPQAIDIGGAFARGVVHDVACAVFAQSFCTRPPLQPVP